MHLEESLIIPDHCAGQRLDQALAQCWPDFSRSRIQDWIKSGDILVDGEAARSRAQVLGGETVVLQTEIEDEVSAVPQDIPLDILYEDDAIIVLNKSPDIVVHPAAGNPDGTLVNALLFHDPALAAVPRAGIVHRLDKQTSGVMVVAKTLAAHKTLVANLAARKIRREYDTVVMGHVVAGGTVDKPIGRHPRDRQRQAVVTMGKPAVTHYRVLQQYGEQTWLRVQLETGRTHQIRVHMAHIRYPVIGDPVYGGRLRLPHRASTALVDILRNFERQALHARFLTLEHPVSGEVMRFEAPLPDDMLELLELLTEHRDRMQHGSTQVDDDPDEAEVIYVRDDD
ncbi:RNA pseudouridine synthase [Halothiobacillus diazotrophicus]|uniref:Pseudouridine synthase n=1 Tax=Halothiobacillus diazotrophicus TaxID=1860122 RepID=A0A191ZIV7_9GAMM|nr:23S rRNA pseudouridine(1911/1915/1917) synthase RluD [Halothiobacillus diazotrophicus]ANJ67819.1 RNA pseudouridine synthase [Halothiobacillus diazotrophicus]